MQTFASEPNGNFVSRKEFFSQKLSPRSPLSPHSPGIDSLDLAIHGLVDNSIEHLYRNVCEMQSSEHSFSRRSFGSDGDESRIDSELRHVLGISEVTPEKSKKNEKTHNPKSKPVSTLRTKSLPVLGAEQLPKPSPKSKAAHNKPPIDSRNQKNTRKPKEVTPNAIEANPDMGPFLLKKAREMVSSGENPQKALEIALRARKSFENTSKGESDLQLVMCLHVLAAIHCRLGQFNEAIPVLERSIEIPEIEKNQEHGLAKFAGCMQLGDIYAMQGQIENSILFYTAGLEIQKQVLGEKDPRVGETCRYVGEAHVQALEFEEAEKFCKMALDIHGETGSLASLEEAADRKLMGLICDSKGDYEVALEHFVLANMALAAHGQETDLASTDVSIGDAYLSLARYDEAVFSYQKALTVFKSTKGENHPTVASVFVRLADLYNKIGKFRESKSYCENALRIYGKPNPGTPLEEIATGFIDVSAIYESMNEVEEALKLLQKALKIFVNCPGQQSTIAGIEAQLGVMYYVLGNFRDSYDSFKNAIDKFRASGEKKSAFFGIALNQMGLACVQLCLINEAADLFEEARSILEKEYGPYHPDTLGVYSNLAGTYDAMGRLNDAIEILDYVVGMREDKLGTANPDGDDEKRRLRVLLKEAGRVRNKKSKSLENLLLTPTLKL